MNEIETLSVKIDTKQISDAADALERLAKAAKRANAALKKLGDVPVTVARAGDYECMQINNRRRNERQVSTKIEAALRLKQ